MTIEGRELRTQLADELEATGSLRSTPLRAAVERVPRHLFVREFFRQVTTPMGVAWEPVTATTVGADRWMRLAYQNVTWVTQLDQGVRPCDVKEPTITGNPTSSSTLPGLVVAMLEDLALEDGSTVMEIGTGSGYSTALLCERLGSEQVVSVETDPAIASEAASAIREAGYAPTLVTADGLRGFEPRAPYDRVIATCSVRSIPSEWIEQTTPGGIVLTTISGWQYGSGYARLTVTPNATAHGEFLPDTYSFMLARPHLPRPADLRSTKDLDASEPRAARIMPDSLDDWTARFVSQLACPDAQDAAKRVGNGPMIDYLIDVRSGSSASLTAQPGNGYLVREVGPIRLWSRIEDAIIAWRDVGCPGIEQFRIYVQPGLQRVFVPGHESLDWTLRG